MNPIIKEIISILFKLFKDKEKCSKFSIKPSQEKTKSNKEHAHTHNYKLVL